MFEPSDRPRIFGMPLGVDFPQALVDHIIAAHKGKPPEELARVHLIVNTRRMARRIRALFDAGPALLLPRISLITDFGETLGLAHIPEPASPLRRRLELINLVGALLEAEPDFAPRSALYDLADSLAGLMDEMHGEGVLPSDIAAIDTGDQSGHWDRIKAFLGIVSPFFETSQDTPDVETRQRLVIESFARLWQAKPPSHPVILAGSTGSRGATQLLMRTIAGLPQGAVVLPGFDFDQPAHVWSKLSDPSDGEDHPQYRFADLLRKLGQDCEAVQKWPGAASAVPARNRLVSLALRPAPVTDEWLTDGPLLAADLCPATYDVTLLEAPSERAEALTIALRLRQAAEEGQTAALITPDRTLTRQVTSALDRWGIQPDDSAGIPLQQSAPGRFLRHVADLFRGPIDAAQLLTLLKHPLTHRGGDRGPHLRLTRELELYLRRKGPPWPSTNDIASWAKAESDPLISAWASWVCDVLLSQAQPEEVPLGQRVHAHLALANKIALGSNPTEDPGTWASEAGRDVLKTVSKFAENADAGPSMDAKDYANLFHAVLKRETVRGNLQTHPKILIWGTLEARVHGAELLILSGLNEGTWPEAPARDPWLNRSMRQQAGLLLPERRVGLSAHDFQQALTATKEVWLTRSIRSDDAETVPSRWLNRLQNLLGGLKGHGGPETLDAMRERGMRWLDRAAAYEAVKPKLPAHRPAPKPPTSARPKALAVTDIKRLIRDPYAIYAKHILRLRPLDPLMKAPDALLRGTILHKVLEEVVKETAGDPMRLTHPFLISKTESILAQNVPWGEARAMWLARMQRVADWFVNKELGRRALASPVAFESRTETKIEGLDFSLHATADRIDIDRSGNLHIYDYKTGTPPTKRQQTYFDKQLLLEAAMAERTGFGEIPPSNVTKAVFIGLGSKPEEVPAPLEDEPTNKVWAELVSLVTAFQDQDQGFLSRRALLSKSDVGDFDQLARFGEWEATDPAAPEVLK